MLSAVDLTTSSKAWAGWAWPWSSCSSSAAISPVSAARLAGLLARIRDNTISGKIAKDVFAAMWAGEGDADAIIEAKGLKQITDSGALEAIVDAVIADNPAQVDNYRNAEPELAARYGVRSLPTLMLFSEGRPQAQTMGAQPEAAIRGFVEPFVSTPADDLARKAADAVSGGDLEEGRRLLEEAVAMDPDRPGPRFALAELLLAADDPQGAREIMDPLNAAAKETDVAHALRDKIRYAEDLEGAPTMDQLAQRIQQDPDDVESRYLLGARLVMAGDLSSAMEQFYEIMSRDRSFRDDAGRAGLISCFNLLEPDSELAASYRKRMAALLH